MREDKSCVRCVRKWYLKQSHNLFPTFLLFFLLFLRSFFISRVSLSLTLVQHTYKWGVCVCITHMCWPKDANRRARIAINKIPLCNYVVTISTTREWGIIFWTIVVHKVRTVEKSIELLHKQSWLSIHRTQFDS